MGERARLINLLMAVVGTARSGRSLVGVGARALRLVVLISLLILHGDVGRFWSAALRASPKHYAVPEITNCDAHRDNNCDDGRWTDVLSHGTLPFLHRKARIGRIAFSLGNNILSIRGQAI